MDLQCCFHGVCVSRQIWCRWNGEFIWGGHPCHCCISSVFEDLALLCQCLEMFWQFYCSAFIDLDDFIFESLDSSTGSIHSMFSWWDKLMIDQFIHKEGFDGVWCFIYSYTQNCGFWCLFSSISHMSWKLLTMVEAFLWDIARAINVF